MNFWRSHRKLVLALCVLLFIFILVMGPMRKRVYHQTYDGSAFIAGFEGKQTTRWRHQDRPQIKIKAGMEMDDSPEVNGRDVMDPPRRRAEKETKNKMAAPEFPEDEAVGDDVDEGPSAPIVEESKPIVQVKNPNTWQRHLKKECEKFGMYDPLTEANFNKDLFKHILVDDKHKVIYCQIPKVATITWRRIFIISTGLANTTDPKALHSADIYGKYDNILQYLGDLSMEDIKYKLRHYFKFVFVREPMERLLSAYRNKMLQNVSSSDFFRKTLGKKIAMEYRPYPEIKKIDPERPGVQFSEFVQYLADRNRKVQWNEHWDKYHQLCYPCTIPYDFVGKLENAQKDANFILKKTGLDEIALFPYRNDTTYRMEETKNILKKYYSTLARSNLRNLVKEYEIDRRLFNYKVPEVVNDILHPR